MQNSTILNHIIISPIYQYFNPLTTMSNQHRICPYNIKQTSDENKKNINQGLIVDPVPNSPNQHYMNYIVDSKENYK